MPAYDKDGSSLYQRDRQFVDVGGTLYSVDRAFVKVAGDLYEYFGGVSGGPAYALLAFDNSAEAAFFTIDLTTGALTQVGVQQILGSSSRIVDAIGTFVIDSTVYALVEVGGNTPGLQGTFRLYTINLTTGVLTQVGTEQLPGIERVTAVGAFAVGSTAYALVESGYTTQFNRTELYTINLTTGVLTQVGSEQIVGSANNIIRGIGAFAVGSTAYAANRKRSSRRRSDDALHHRLDHCGADTSRLRTTASSTGPSAGTFARHRSFYGRFYRLRVSRNRHHCSCPGVALHRQLNHCGADTSRVNL